MNRHTSPTGAPLVIECAITPFRLAEPDFDVDGAIAQAHASISAGAAVIHFHHDFRAGVEDSTREMVAVGAGIVARHPGTIVYPDFIGAPTWPEKTAHLDPMARAGALGMVPIDPGGAMIGGLDRNGRPTTRSQYGMRYEDANAIADWAYDAGIPVNVGVFEPGNMRWALAWSALGRMTRGSILKFYFGGENSIVQIGHKAMNFGLPPTRESLDAYIAMAAPSGLPWCVAISGGELLDTPLARYALERGGHLRVGIEDGGGTSPLTNAQMVAAAVDLANQVGRTVVQGDAALAALVSA